jgi:hypothetical protein
MVYNLGKKCSKTAFLAYLIFAIIGTFTISTGQTSYFEHSNKDIIGSGRYCVSISCAVDCFIEDTTTIGKALRFSNSPLRSGLLRVFTLAGTIAIALYLAGVNLKTIKNINIPLAKNQILLKLRI